jgi:hypothetical protein
VEALLAEAQARDALPIDVAVEQALARVTAARAVPAAEPTT